MPSPAGRSAFLALALPAALALASAGCGQARPFADGGTGTSGTDYSACTTCHGDATRPELDPLVQAAPPRSVNGGDGGAHLAHLHDGAYRSALACAECHVVPRTTAHSSGTVDLAFGPLARSGGASPSFAGGSCASVYCHGATLGAGGARTVPAWNGGPSEVSCGSCHGAPPPSHDPGSTSCSSCHPGTVKADGTINLANGMHIDGQVQVNEAHPSGWADPAQHGAAAKQGIAACQACHGADFGGGTSGVSCNACHGGTAWQANCTFCHGARVASYTAADLRRAAPPLGTRGETSPSERAVGAHQTHLAGNALGNAVACTDCHATLPTSLAHVLGQPATVEFGAGARRGGATPSWNGATCTSYCHGATLGAGGTNLAPTWTGGAAQAACGTCHGAPPPAPHTSDTRCGSCHSGYGATSVNLALHIDGKLDVTSSCTSCHGDSARAANPAAPPRGTRGETATTARAVGAHQVHLTGNALGRAIACTECHTVPGSTSHSNGTVDLTWGPLSRASGATPSWNGATCANYCHGATLGAGGTNRAPSWTGGAAQAACGTCHGAPPPAPHMARTDCGACHGGYGAATVNLTTHVNGTVDFSVTCSSCHGLPPSSGEHGEHSGRSCGDCHPGFSRTAVNAATHRDGTAEIGNRITRFTGGTCTNSCHGDESW